MKMGQVRALASIIGSRFDFARRAGKTFGGKRDLYEVLGWKKGLTIEDYRGRFSRNSVAGRIIEALPKATWRGGGEIIEDNTTPTMTPFEQEFADLAIRLKIWRIFCRADMLAGLGHYGGILLGAPGALDTELQQMRGPEDLVYLKPYAEDRLTLDSVVENSADARYGQPLMYLLKKDTLSSFGRDREVHWSRVIHICDNLEDDVFAPPKLERVWNDLDNLEKITGGGSEAFWLRAHPGYQIDVDKEVEFADGEEGKLEDEVEKFVHEISRVMRTRGTKVNVLDAQIADMSGSVSSIMGLISAGTGIPQRILMGSERGEQASTQDRDNWFDQVADRRDQFASPNCVHQFVDRGIAYGFLSKPATYDTRWSQLQSMDENQRADLGIKIATINKYQGETVIYSDEIRDEVFGKPPATNEQKAAEAAKLAAKQKVTVAPGRPGPQVDNGNPPVRVPVAAIEGLSEEISELRDEIAARPNITVNPPSPSPRKRTKKHITYGDVNGMMRPINIVEEDI